MVPGTHTHRQALTYNPHMHTPGAWYAYTLPGTNIQPSHTYLVPGTHTHHQALLPYNPHMHTPGAWYAYTLPGTTPHHMPNLPLMSFFDFLCVCVIFCVFLCDVQQS